MKRLLSSVLLACLPLSLGGCNPAPVEWRDPTWTSVTTGEVHVDGAGQTRIVAAHVAPPVLPGAPPRCEESYRFSWIDSAQVYAAWWAPRADRSAALLASYSADGGRTWAPPVSVDSTDVSAAGCSRPSPGVAGDGTVVHVVYALTSSEGTGIFFAHSMDHATLFHSPVAVEYGERFGAAAVAAHGNRVVVAYEDVNDRSQIGLAISRTMGHIFEQRTPVTSGAGAATLPQVALSPRADVVAVSWLQRASPDTGRAVRLIRVGRLHDAR